MSDNSSPSVCPRCSGQLLGDLYGEYHCLQCGCVVYTTEDPRPSSYLRQPVTHIKRIEHDTTVNPISGSSYELYAVRMRRG